LSDGALISLRANSDYRIVAQQTGKGLMEQAGKLFSGWMRTVTGSIAEENPDAVKQETPVATIGIRGTTYQVIHMPEGGLPGVPESEPGTYIYLQQGGIESSAGGETRFMGPGDVVFVPIDGGPPVPAPDKKNLFSSSRGKTVKSEDGARLETLGADRGAESEDREDLESTDGINDGVNQDLSATRTLPGGGALGSFTVNGSPFFMQSPGEDVLVQNPLVQMKSTGSLGLEGGEARFVAQVDEGAKAVNYGSYTLDSRNSLFWGIWRRGEYSLTARQQDGTTTEVTGLTDWHYIVADNAFTSADAVIGLGLTGQATYDYVGGTGLTSESGDTVRIDGGSIQVDFDNLASTQAMQVNIALSANGSYEHDYSGSGTLSDFYNPPEGGSSSGLFLGRDDEQGNGIIYGQFAGQDAEAIISGLNLDDNDFDWLNGTAAFTQVENNPENQQEAADRVAMGVTFATNTGYGSPASIFTSTPDVTVRDESGDRVVDDLTFQEPVDGGTYELSSMAGQTPSGAVGTHTLADADNTRIDWGVWDSSQHTLTVDGTDIAEADRNDWHYMVADNYLNQTELADRVNSGSIACRGTEVLQTVR
jgi:hypothetical protein